MRGALFLRRFGIVSMVAITAMVGLAFGEPDGLNEDGGLRNNSMRAAKEGECIWYFVDAVEVRADLMPGKPQLTQETRVRLCYHGWTYSLTTYQRFVDPDGKSVTQWQAVSWVGDGYTKTMWIAIRAGDKVAGPPPWGEDVFPWSMRLPE